MTTNDPSESGHRGHPARFGFQAVIHTAQAASCPPPRSSTPADMPATSGHQRSRSTAMRAAMRASGPPPGVRASLQSLLDLIPASHPDRQAASLPPPTSGPAGRRAGGATGNPRSIGVRATSDPGRTLAGCLHPRCQAESLPPQSPPSCIPAAPHTSGHAGMRAGPPAIPLDPPALLSSHPKAFSPDASILSRRRLRRRAGGSSGGEHDR